MHFYSWLEHWAFGMEFADNLIEAKEDKTLSVYKTPEKGPGLRVWFPKLRNSHWLRTWKGTLSGQKDLWLNLHGVVHGAESLVPWGDREDINVRLWLLCSALYLICPNSKIHNGPLNGKLTQCQIASKCTYLLTTIKQS